MRKNNIRMFKEFAENIAIYTEKPEEFMKRIRNPSAEGKSKKDELDVIIEHKEPDAKHNVSTEGMKKKIQLKQKKIIKKDISKERMKKEIKKKSKKRHFWFKNSQDENSKKEKM